MFSISQQENNFYLNNEGQNLESPNGNLLKSQDENLMKKVIDFLNENGMPDLGDVNVYNLLLSMVDNYPNGLSSGKAHLRKQLWRDPVFHTSPSRELEDARKHCVKMVKEWYATIITDEMPSIFVEDAEDDEEEIGFFPLEELKAQWPNYNYAVKQYEGVYNKLNIRQKTVVTCLSQTFDAFHISLYLMFVTGAISDSDLAECLYESFDLPLENIGQAVKGSADEDKELNQEEFEQYKFFISY